MNIKHIWRLYRSFILSLSLLLVCVIGLLVGVLPVLRSSLDMVGIIQKLETRTSTLSAKQRFLQGLDESTTRKNLEILLSAVPSNKSLPTIFTTTDAVVAASGLSPIDMSITSPGSLATEAATKKTAEEKQIGVLLQPFTVTVEGTVDNFAAFLQNVITVRRLLRVKSFSATSTMRGTVQVHIDLDAFYNPLPKTLGGVNEPLPQASNEDDTMVSKIAAYPGQSLTVGQVLETGRTNPFRP